MEEDLEIPILFGRPFFMTAGAIIDIRKGKITLKVDNEHMEFDVSKIMKSLPVEVARRIETIDIIDECIEEVIHEHLKQDPMETNMVSKANEHVIKVTKYQPSRWPSRFEPLKREDDLKDTTSSEGIELEIKPLPSNLR